MHQTWFEREEDGLDRDLAEGRITPQEHRQGLREIRMEMECAAEDAAREAYDDAMGRMW